jgi:hypothetical protein
MKQHLGLGDYQHHSLLPTLRFLHLVAVAYSIGKITLLKYSNATGLVHKIIMEIPHGHLSLVLKKFVFV